MRYRKRSLENSRAGAQAYEALLRQKLVSLMMPRILDSSCSENWSNPCPGFWTAVCEVVLGRLVEEIGFCAGFGALGFCGGERWRGASI